MMEITYLFDVSINIVIVVKHKSMWLGYSFEFLIVFVLKNAQLLVSTSVLGSHQHQSKKAGNYNVQICE